MSKDKFDYFIKGEKNNYEVIIGLEVHAQVSSNSKLFSGSALTCLTSTASTVANPDVLHVLQIWFQILV